MTRRQAMEKLFAAIAAGAAWPALASALDWQPQFLNSGQNEALIALSETIIPGSAKAQVNRFIDLLLTVDTAEHQKPFVESLSEVEQTTKARFGRPFHQLAANEKDELLTSFSTDKVHQEHFDTLKEWITLAYYSSEDGMRELGWTGQHAFRSFPVCDLPR
jgi:hypothetical protein